MANKYQKYVNTPSGATDYQTREAQRKYGSGVTYKNGQLYADGRSFASEADLLKYQQGQTKLGDFYRDLSRYNAEQNKYTEQLRNRFKSQAELAGAQATLAAARHRLDPWRAGGFAPERNDRENPGAGRCGEHGVLGATLLAHAAAAHGVRQQGVRLLPEDGHDGI